MTVLLLILTCSTIWLQSVADKRTLHVGALFELSNHWYTDYANFFINIIEHVFEEVENRTDILRDYSLKLITRDTEGNSGLAARRMFELMTEGPPLVAVLGPSLSSEMTVVGQLGPVYNVLQLSYIATTSSTVDQELFSTLFRVNQIMGDLNPLRIKMMQYFNWNRVGTIFFQDDQSVSQMNIFHDLLKQYNMTLLTSAVVTDNTDIKVLISRFLQYDVRIIMGSFKSRKAPRIFCEAYKQGLYGSRHVWILAGPILYANWISDIGVYGTDCTTEQLLRATDGHFTLNYNKVDERNSLTINNLTPENVTAILKRKVAQTNYKLSANYGYVYDTAWALAVALNNSLRYLNDSGLDQYTNNLYYLQAILEGMHTVNFAGVSGPVSFDDRGSRIGVTYIEQNFNDTRIPVALYNPLTSNLTWYVNVESLWPGKAQSLHGISYIKFRYTWSTSTGRWVVKKGKEIPQDKFTYHRVMVAANIPALVMIMIGNTLCLVVALGFLGFNICYRKNSNIKLSSPMINNIIIAGSILMFIGIFITTFEYGHLMPEYVENHMCMVRVWIVCLGFTALFGALFSKTWRVHILFRDYKIRKTSELFTINGMSGDQQVVKACINNKVYQKWDGKYEGGNSVYMRTRQATYLHICILERYLQVLPDAMISLCFAVYSLPTDSQSIKDYHLFGIIVFLLLFDSIVLFSWTLTHSLRRESFVRNRKDPYSLGNIISVVYTYCHHPNEGYWFVSIYIYKGLLLVFGTFLAWETRHVTVPALNDSKLIGFCIYNVVIVCVFGVPLTHVLPREQTTLNFVLPSTLIMFCTTMCLCILFIPKIRIRNKVGERFLNPSLNSKAAASSGSSSNNKAPKGSTGLNVIEVSRISKENEFSDAENRIIDELKSENHRLRMEIATESVAMARLKRDLVRFTGNVHFYKVGQTYVVSHIDTESRQQADNGCVTDQNKAPENESEG